MIYLGNGTEHVFEKDPNIMYASLHRFDQGNAHNFHYILLVIFSIFDPTKFDSKYYLYF